MSESMNWRWLRWCMSGIVVLLAVIAVELGTFIGPFEPRAAAQIPDSGLQRKQMLDEQDRSNVLLDGILQHLRTSTLKVRVVGTDKDTKTQAVTPENNDVPPAPRIIRKP